MSDPQAFLNGQFVPASQATIPLYDLGFAMGVTVTEQLRTFGGKLFHLDDHVRRLFHSLEIVGIEPGMTATGLRATANELAARNHPLLADGDDLGMAIFVTPGPQRSLSSGVRGGPMLGMHTFPLDFGLWAEKYGRGESLVVTPRRHMPASCWPPELKCRSRMHYYLADCEASAADPGARALLTDSEGFVTETASSNVLVHRREQGLLTPPREKTLPGISLEAAIKLAETLGIAVIQQDLRPEDVAMADEVLLTSTPYCVLPVVRLNRQPIATGKPGPLFAQLMEAWNAEVGLNIVEQATKFAALRST